MTKIVWTDPAIGDLDAIHEYISRDAEIYADAVITDIIEAVDRLELFPESGRIVPEFGDKTIREIITKNYRIVYNVSGEEIIILTVLHGSQRFHKPE